eukprot:NODE_25232_length_594_cov_4.246253.p1 GENE.NODE_25232_length_594_cov_4.246253~~NODE_25232_length_594_cov_4.246253.p1  ORF type:complete len:144 (+),score=30.15 NODE_25232_length_594_cov_4.246253:124-555(+)
MHPAFFHNQPYSRPRTLTASWSNSPMFDQGIAMSPGKVHRSYGNSSYEVPSGHAVNRDYSNFGQRGGYGAASTSGSPFGPRAPSRNAQPLVCGSTSSSNMNSASICSACGACFQEEDQHWSGAGGNTREVYCDRCWGVWAQSQ